MRVPKTSGRQAGDAADGEPVAAAILGVSGDVCELNDSRGRRLLAGEPDLSALLRAFLECELADLRFVWLSSEQHWYSVQARRQLGLIDSEPAATVEALRVEAPYGLTERELDVLTLMAGGLSNPEIAGHLVSSRRTVSTHVEHILQKLGQVNRAGAAGVAVQEGLLRLPVPGGGRSIDALPVGQVDQQHRGWTHLSKRDRGPIHAAWRNQPRPFLIGSAFALQGPAAPEGLELQRGSALAIAEVNARGGIAGRRVEQLAVNVDIFSPTGIRSAFERLVDAEVDAITTGFAFAEEPECYEPPNAYGCPLLSVMTSEAQADWVRQAPEEFGQLFQMGPTEINYGTGFIRFLDDLVEAERWNPPNRRLVFVETPVPGGRMTGQQTVRRAEESGWTIDSILHVATQAANWDPVLDAIRKVCPAAVMIAHFVPSELMLFHENFVGDPTDSLVYGIYAPSTPGFLDMTTGLAEGLVWSTLSGLYEDRIAGAFSASYESTFGAAPGRCLAGVGYDQANILIQAWAHIGNPRAFAEVRNQLRLMTYRGVNGSYSLGNDGQCSLAFPDQTSDPSISQAQLVFQIQDGCHRLLGPAPYVEGQFELPPWFTSA